jgi:hypothetical protein
LATLLVGFDSAWTARNTGGIVGVLRDDMRKRSRSTTAGVELPNPNRLAQLATGDRGHLIGEVMFVVVSPAGL